MNKNKPDPRREAAIMASDRDQLRAELREALRATPHARLLELMRNFNKLTRARNPEIKTMAGFALYGLDLAIETYGCKDKPAQPVIWTPGDK